MKRKIILLLGANGQLGTESQCAFATIGDVLAYDYPQINFQNLKSLRSLIQETAPDLIINAAAYTAVDKAEDEKEIAYSVNASASGLLAEEAAKLDIPFFHYSTDYVFDGKKPTPYTENEQTNPLNVYGASKLSGEQAVTAIGGKYFIFRTSWVYSMRPSSFTGKVLSWARKNETLRIVDDQIGSPTWARALAEVSAQALVYALCKGEDWQKEHSGIYHLGGDGAASRMEWAKAILKHDPNKEEQLVKQILPAKTKEFPIPAERPLTSILDCTKFKKTFQLSLPAWDEALRLAFLTT